MIRWIIRDNIKVLQYFEGDDWVDVPEIYENKAEILKIYKTQEQIYKTQENEHRELEDPKK